MMLNIVLQDNLKAYLKKHHHDTISLRLVHNDYATGNINTINPEIHFKKPYSPENYNEYHIDDVTIYIDKEAEAYDDTLEFVEEKALALHHCHVKGLKLDKVEM
ncbi:MAG: hypothetical protein K8R73_01905 [Clostridiales bacterium]|nr:hypothetical protein [Clostridiales bacterium]